MTAPEPILAIDPSWRVNNEDMGSKPKFWFRYEDEMWLYKEARENTGEHWAEKVASEIAGLLGLPTHEVKLATYEGKAGCAVRNFLNPSETLIHGNELLDGALTGYDKDKWQGQSDHNFDNIVKALEHTFAVEEVRKRVSYRFVGYMALDALVGNTDRHHENWGIIQELAVVEDEQGEARFVLRKLLAPTFDHGSSLGRELLEDRALRLLQDPSHILRYINKARGGIFRDSHQAHGMSPIDLLELIAARYPDFFKPWQERIGNLPPNFAQPLLDKVPGSFMSPISKQFALAFLKESRKLILSIT